MRSSVVLVAIGAAFVAAQSLSDLPACGQTCIHNMLQIAPSFGCAQGNITCYCTQPDFGYGIRDCSTQSCPTTADANEVIAFGKAYCKKALAGSGATPSAATATGASSSGAAGTGASSSGASSSGAAGTGASSSGASSSGAVVNGGGKRVPISTKTLSGAETVGGKKVTTATGTSTIYGIASLVRTTKTSGGKTMTKVIGTTTLSGAKASKATATTKKGGSGGGGGKGGGNGGGNGGGSGGGSGNGSGNGSAKSANLAPMATAMPGLFGAALIAVLAL